MEKKVTVGLPEPLTRDGNIRIGGIVKMQKWMDRKMGTISIIWPKLSIPMNLREGKSKALSAQTDLRALPT